MTISELTLKTRKDEPVRRFEVFTGTGRHRDWSDEEKAQIVAESYSADVMVFAVARRHGLSPEQLFTRRRLLRKRERDAVEAAPMFVPAIVDALKEPAAAKVRRARSPGKASTSAAIELEIDGATVRIASGADARTIAAVVQALKGFPEAITAAFPQTTVQTCIVHLIRHSLEFVSSRTESRSFRR